MRESIGDSSTADDAKAYRGRGRPLVRRNEFDVSIEHFVRCHANSTALETLKVEAAMGFCP